MLRRVLVTVLVTATCALVAPVATARPAAAADATSRFQPIAPVRLADTREADCGCTRPDGDTLRVVVAGRAGIPADIVAAALTVTVAEPSAPGFASVYPAGTPRPVTSTVNIVDGNPVANSTIVRVGAAGAVDVFTLHPTQVIVDVTGVFVAAASSAAGRFVPLPPARLLDTRETGAPLAPGASVVVPLPASVSADATALAVNVTSVDEHAAGFVTGSAAGAAAPATSFLNPDGSGGARSSSVILPVSAGGLALTTTAGGQLVVDIVGWFTGPSAPLSSAGLFVPIDPRRLLDTRAAGPRLWPGGTRELASPVAAAALVTNVTLDRTDGPGFVTAYPAGTGLPGTSSVNAPTRETIVANMAITPLSDRGIAYYANRGTDVIIDMTGSFTGAPVASSSPVLADDPPNSRVLLVGDSTLAALDVVPQAQRALTGFTPVVDAQPCRRLVQPSCQSRFTLRVPNTAVQAISSTPGALDGVVVKSGYNDGAPGFADAVTRVVAASRAKGAKWVIWLTYSEGPNTPNGSYVQNNATLRRLAASGAYDDLVVADWRTYADGSHGWYADDRVHLLGAGAWATADYIARWVAAVQHMPCPRPWTVAGTLDDPCPSPDSFAAATGTLPDLRGLYGF